MLHRLTYQINCTTNNTLSGYSQTRVYSVSVRMFPVAKTISSFYDITSNWNEPYDSHSIKYHIWRKCQSGEKGKVSSQCIHNIQPQFLAQDHWEGHQGVEIRLRHDNTMKDYTNAKEWIQEPRKAMPDPYSLHSKNFHIIHDCILFRSYRELANTSSQLQYHKCIQFTCICWMNQCMILRIYVSFKFNICYLMPRPRHIFLNSYINSLNMKEKLENGYKINVWLLCSQCMHSNKMDFTS